MDSLISLISVGILTLNLWIYKYYPGRHKSVRIMKKFIVGMCCAAASMLAAGTVEIFRQKKCIPGEHDMTKKKNNLIISSKFIGATYSTVSIYVQLIPNILIGFSQLFGTIAGYEYAYFAAPRSSQSLFMSLYFFSSGLAFVIGLLYFNFFPTADVYIDFQVSSISRSMDRNNTKFSFCSLLV